jgi:hypothetical protein
MPRTSCPLTSLVLPADHASSLGACRYLVAPRVKDLATTPSGVLECVGENQKVAPEQRSFPSLPQRKYFGLLSHGSVTESYRIQRQAV